MEPPLIRQATSPLLTESRELQVLGVDKKADAQEIKRAFKRLAMRNHPDVSKDPNAKVLKARGHVSLHDLLQHDPAARIPRRECNPASHFATFPVAWQHSRWRLRSERSDGQHLPPSDLGRVQEIFIEINEAYAVLSDPDQRRKYDLGASNPFAGWGSSSRSSSSTGSTRRGTGGAAPTGGDFDFDAYWKQQRAGYENLKDIDDSFSKIFDDIFTGVKKARKGGKGRDSMLDDVGDFLETVAPR